MRQNLVEDMDSQVHTETKVILSAAKHYVKEQRSRVGQLREACYDLFLFSLVGALYWSAASTELWWISSLYGILLGLVGVHLVLLMHDCLHDAAFNSSQLNTWVGRIIGAYGWVPFSFIRISHKKHHSNAGTERHDPEILHYTKAFADRRKCGHLLANIGHSRFIGPLLYPILYQAIDFYEWFVSAIKENRPEELKAVGLDLLCMLVFWGIGLGVLAAQGYLVRGLVFGSLIPFAVGLSTTFYFARPLHCMNYSGDHFSNAHTVVRSLLVCRSFEVRGWTALLLFNFNFHIEHHIHPRVSRWYLGKFSRSLRGDLVKISKNEGIPFLMHKSYISWMKTYRKLNQKYNPILSLNDFRFWNRNFLSKSEIV